MPPCLLEARRTVDTGWGVARRLRFLIQSDAAAAKKVAWSSGHGATALPEHDDRLLLLHAGDVGHWTWFLRAIVALLMHCATRSGSGAQRWRPATSICR